MIDVPLGYCLVPEENNEPYGCGGCFFRQSMLENCLEKEYSRCSNLECCSEERKDSTSVIFKLDEFYGKKKDQGMLPELKIGDIGLDIEPLRWKGYETETECPLCNESFTIIDSEQYSILKYCPNCGQRLLPPKEEE